MNTLVQDSSLLLGSKKEIEALSFKDSSRLLVVSDSHGAYFILESILRFSGAESDALVFCGDGISDIAHLIETAVEKEEIQAFIPPVIGIVEGNNDSDLYPVRNVMKSGSYYTEISAPLFNVISVSGHKVFFTHGHRYALYSGTDRLSEMAEKAGCRLALFGHTHIAMEKMGKVFLLNPGSCRFPRGGQKPSFATVTLKKNSDSVESIFYCISENEITPFFPERIF